MALEKKVGVDVLIVNIPSGNVSVQQRTAIVEDGVEISSHNHVHMVEKGDSALASTVLPEKLVPVVEALWKALE